MKNKKLLALLMCLVLCCVSCIAFAESNTVKIGVVAGITGNDPLEGERMVQAIEMANDQLTAAGGINGTGVMIELDIQDSQGTTDGALNAFQKCIGDGCVAIIGPHKSSAVMAVGATADEDQIPFIYGGTSPNLLGQYSYGFGVRTNDKYAAQIGAKVCVDTLNATKVGVLYGSDDYGSGGMNVATAYFDEVGVAYVTEAFNSGDTDITGQILALNNAGVDAILAWSHGIDLAVVSRTMYDLGVTTPVVSASGAAVQQYIDLCEPEWIEGWYVVAEYLPTSTAEVAMQFAADFKAATGEDGELFSSSYYGGFKVLLTALENCETYDSASIFAALKNVQNVAGVLGTMSCDAENQFMHSAVLAKMVDAVPEVIEEFSL